MTDLPSREDAKTIAVYIDTGISRSVMQQRQIKEVLLDYADGRLVDRETIDYEAATTAFRVAVAEEEQRTMQDEYGSPVEARSREVAHAVAIVGAALGVEQ